MRFLCALLAAAWLASAASAADPPVFPDQYTAHGVIFLPYAELRETFSAYYDGTLNRSRIDYYGDLMITVQKSRAAVKDDADLYGAEYQIAYEADIKGKPTRVCFKTGGSTEQQVTGQTVLPNLDGFVRIGSTRCPIDNVNDFQEGSIRSKAKLLSKPLYTKGHPASCELWRKKETIGEKQNIYSFWFKKDPKTGEAIPVTYEMRGYNNLLGSHYDHYIVHYTNFRDGLMNEELFNIDSRFKCGDFPGPGDGKTGSRRLLMNPIKAYFDTNRKAYDEHFDEYKDKHNKTYDTEFEHEHRRKLFLDNSRFILSTNRRNPSFKLAINHLTDKSEDELKILRGRIPPKKDNGGLPFSHGLGAAQQEELPAYWDWRLHGAVTQVRDQAVCGSCWVFGTLGAIDSAYFIKYGHLPILAEQQVVDCAWPFEVNGCSGGNDVAVYKYAMQAGGLALEDDYGAYLGVDGKCHATETKKTVKLGGWVNVTQYSIEDMKRALVENGPVTIAINAAVKTFSYYSSGVYDDPKCVGGEADLDHQVLLVGYGTLNGKDYWLVKNSWSTYWGNDGYILIAQKDNICGVTTQATYPIID